MGTINSFRDVIQDLFYNEIFEELSSHVEENPSEIDCISYDVECPDEASLDFFEVKRVNIKKAPDDRLDFDVIVSADLVIGETVKRNRETDGVEQWFRISCSAVLDDGISDFTVQGVDVYNKYNTGKENNLSEYLVPIIYKEQYDSEAEKFLQKYYPEALEKPMPVSVETIVERMGLRVQEAHITKHRTVFGQIFFSDCTTQYYDSEHGIYRNLDVKRGTILVDPDVYFMRNFGSTNNTVIHECLHWDLHRKFFELEKLFNEDAHAIRCQVKEGVRPERNRTPLDWMETHANHIAPRVLMPEKQTRQLVEELIEKNKKALQTDNIADIMESVVYELSDFFNVSKLSAKIRLIDLGYNQAIGVLTYVDDRYVASHAFERDAIKNNQTFTIGIQDALYEYAINSELRQMVDDGKYLYVDSHFCINDSKYVRQNDYGVPELTDYARQHIDECCLIFDVKARVNNRYGVKYYKEAVLFREAISEKIIEIKYSDSGKNKETDARAEELRSIGREARQIANIARSLPATFADTLTAHMDRLEVTVEELEERSLITDRTIRRMKNEIGYRPKLNTVVAVCVGLQLPPDLSMDLINKSGHTLMAFDEEHVIYRFILHAKHPCSILECNEILRANNRKPLSKES